MFIRNYISYCDYRYGFNGMEKDDEIKGGGNSYDFGARMYDSRLGRFLSIDPMAAEYSSQSTYCFASNMVIVAIDANGEGPIVVIQSRVKSEEFKTLMKKYDAGEIKWDKLKERLDEYTGSYFTSSDDVKWLKKNYDKSALTYKTCGYMLDPDDEGGYMQIPMVAYKNGYDNVNRNMVHVTITEQQEDGTWQQVEYEIDRPKGAEGKLPGPSEPSSWKWSQNLDASTGDVVESMTKWFPGPSQVTSFYIMKDGYAPSDPDKVEIKGFWNRYFLPAVDIVTVVPGGTGVAVIDKIGALQTTATATAETFNTVTEAIEGEETIDTSNSSAGSSTGKVRRIEPKTTEN